MTEDGTAQARRSSTTVPSSALWLGAFGAIPFLGLAGATPFLSGPEKLLAGPYAGGLWRGHSILSGRRPLGAGSWI